MRISGSGTLSEGKINDELKKWAVEKMVIFYELIQPELDKLK